MQCEVSSLWMCSTNYSSCSEWLSHSLGQGCFTYRHNQVLHCLTLELSEFLAELNTVHVYADLPGMRASESPQGTIPSSLMVTSYCPDIVIHNITCNSVALLELTCPLDSMQYLESARGHKQSKEEYLQILSELDRMGVPSRLGLRKSIILQEFPIILSGNSFFLTYYSQNYAHNSYDSPNYVHNLLTM